MVQNISLSVTNCQHVKSGLHWIVAAAVMLKLLYQMLSIGFVLPSIAEVAISHTL